MSVGQAQAGDLVIAYLAKDIVTPMPEGLANALSRPSGRNPSNLSLHLSAICNTLPRADAVTLFRYVIDATLFSVCYAVAADFKNIGVRAEFVPIPPGAEVLDRPLLHELYRQAVDPGGVIA